MCGSDRGFLKYHIPLSTQQREPYISRESKHKVNKGSKVLTTAPLSY